jgi:hypothetical protein
MALVMIFVLSLLIFLCVAGPLNSYGAKGTL